MTVAGGQFEHVAQVVTQRAADLLSAQVSITDERGVVIASSLQRTVGLRLRQNGARGDDALRVPIQLDSRTGEVVITRKADGEVISPRIAQALIDLVVNEAAVVTRLPNQYDLKNKFIHDLLMGSMADEADAIREGQILGMDFSPPRAVVLIDAADYILRSDGSDGSEPDGTSIRRRAQFVISSIVGFFQLPSDTICGYIGNGEVAILKASATQDLVAWTNGESDRAPASASWANLGALKRAAKALLMRLRRDTGAAIGIGIGRYHPGIRGLSQSYQDARMALSLGRRLHGQNQVHCLDTLGIAAFAGVAEEQTKVDLARHLLSPLDREPDLLQTVETFFDENCCPSETARRLAIHRNTLGYRLEKVASIIGLDPRRFDDAVQIRVALLLRSFQKTDA